MPPAVLVLDAPVMDESAPAVMDCGQLKVAISRKARNRLLVELWGTLDAASAAELERKLYLPRRAKVDLDLGGITAVDEAGMRFLVGVCGKSGGKANVIATSPAARRALVGQRSG